MRSRSSGRTSRCCWSDADDGFTDQDARVGRLSRDRGVAALILANKWDRLRGSSRGEQVRKDVAHGLRFMADAPVLAVSAKTGAGIGALFARVRELRETSHRQIPTADLNRWLQDAVRRHEPAMAQRGSRRRLLKFFYATQTGVRPPTFTLFCTEPAAVQPAYRRFLENRLRDAFELAGLRCGSGCARARRKPRAGAMRARFWRAIQPRPPAAKQPRSGG